MNVPKEMRPAYDQISALLIGFCRKYLNDEYEAMLLHALEKLCRKRPSPLKSGRSSTWAAGITWAVGSNNFLFDKSQLIHMSGKEVAAAYGVAPSTAANKASDIRKMLKISYFDPEWSLDCVYGSSDVLDEFDDFMEELLLEEKFLQEMQKAQKKKDP